MNIEIPAGYESLGHVLQMAVDQAANGKGKERHACGEPFDQQKICRISRFLGVGFALGQAEKKIEESVRLDGEAGQAELLGAINYVAAGLIVMAEENLREVTFRIKHPETFGDTLDHDIRQVENLGNLARKGVGAEERGR